MRFGKKFIIFGCEARGDKHSAYMTRYTLIETTRWQLLLHHFHRSDAEEHHDHPFWFISLILWRGYIEETPAGKRRFYPGMILIRPAAWRHRVELVGERPAITLVLTGPKYRPWGFFTKDGWQFWKVYFRERGC